VIKIAVTPNLLNSMLDVIQRKFGLAFCSPYLFWSHQYM